MRQSIKCLVRKQETALHNDMRFMGFSPVINVEMMQRQHVPPVTLAATQPPHIHNTMPLAPYLGTHPRLDAGVFIHTSAQVIGDVTLGRDSSVWCNAVLRGDVNRIVVGECSNVQDLTMGHVSHRNASKPEGSPLVIGSYVTVGHSVILHGCRIGNECLIGMGSIVMDDAVIEDRVMLGAGSLVSPGKVLESGYLYIGRPAVRQRALTGAEITYLKYSAEHYVRVKNNYPTSLQPAPQT